MSIGINIGMTLGRGGGASIAAPANSVLPVISGTLNVGQLLTTTDGTWSGTPTYTYQWKRGGVSIGGATNNTYTTVMADLGTTITATVTATNAGGSAAATSAGVVIVLDLTLAGALSPAVVLLANAAGTTYAGQTTLYQDTALTTPATAASDPVKGWKDLSGNNRHYLQGGAGLFPLRDVIGTVAAVAFDGTDDNLAANGVFAIAQPVTYIAILRRGANDSAKFIMRGAQVDSASFLASVANIQLYAGSATDPTVACASGTSAVAVGVFNGAASQLWINGGAVATGNPGTHGVRINNAPMVGGGTAAGVAAANVRLGAALIYPGALSLAQINAIAVPLAALWGITAAAFT